MSEEKNLLNKMKDISDAALSLISDDIPKKEETRKKIERTIDFFDNIVRAFEIKDIVKKYAKEQGLIIDISIDGYLTLLKRYNKDNTEQIVFIYAAHDHFGINVYRAGPDGYLSSVDKGIAKPIQELGHDIVFINRDTAAGSAYGGLIVYDTRQRKEKC